MVSSGGRAACLSDEFCDIGMVHSLYPYALKMKERGVTNGCGETDGIMWFCPDHKLRRDGGAKFLVRGIFGFSEEAEPSDDFENPYLDPPSVWDSKFFNLIMFLTEERVFSGFGDGKFHPERYFTRGQWAKGVVESLERRGIQCQDYQKNEDVFKAQLTDIEGSAFYDQQGVRSGLQESHFLLCHPPHLGVPHRIYPDVGVGKFRFTLFQAQNGLPDQVWCLWGLIRAHRPDVRIGYFDQTFRPNRDITRIESSKWSMIGMELISSVEQESSEGQNNSVDTVLEFFGNLFSRKQSRVLARDDIMCSNFAVYSLVVPWNDEDWIKLHLDDEAEYVIKTTGNGLNADIKIDIVSEDGEAILASSTGLARDGGTSLSWSPPQSGVYFARLTNTLEFAVDGTYLDLSILNLGAIITFDRALITA